jgi:two-component system, chemotaxis family, protein-glutamate methylesterase/glutaminase
MERTLDRVETALAAVRERRDLVVIGASAGGVGTLAQVVAGLPSTLSAAVCIVLHIAPESPSALAGILARAGSLPCRPARDGDPLVAGEILVAPPNRHLVIEDGRVRLTVGPRENNHRPAVDVLFRAAAHAQGPRVLGVVLTGTRDDGTAGLAVIKARGGAAIVQDPADALYPGMPANALRNVPVDAVLPSSEIATAIERMVDDEPTPSDHTMSEHRLDKGSTGGILICPECGGVLSERSEAGVPRWECRVGHRYSTETLADAQAEGVEAALWAAIRALTDRARLLHQLADRAQSNRQEQSAGLFRRRAELADQQADLVRGALTQTAQTALRDLGDSTEPENEVA